MLHSGSMFNRLWIYFILKLNREKPRN